MKQDQGGNIMGDGITTLSLRIKDSWPVLTEQPARPPAARLKNPPAAGKYRRHARISLLLCELQPLHCFHPLGPRRPRVYSCWCHVTAIINPLFSFGSSGMTGWQGTCSPLIEEHYPTGKFPNENYSRGVKKLWPQHFAARCQLGWGTDRLISSISRSLVPRAIEEIDTFACSFFFHLCACNGHNAGIDFCSSRGVGTVGRLVLHSLR